MAKLRMCVPEFKIFGQGFSVIQSPRGIALFYYSIYIYYFYYSYYMQTNVCEYAFCMLYYTYENKYH